MVWIDGQWVDRPVEPDEGPPAGGCLLRLLLGALWLVLCLAAAAWGRGRRE